MTTATSDDLWRTQRYAPLYPIRYDAQNRLINAFLASYAYDTAGRLTSYEGIRYGYAAAPAPPMALTAGRGLWARAPPREHHSGRHRTAGALVLPLLSSRV